MSARRVCQHDNNGRVAYARRGIRKWLLFYFSSVKFDNVTVTDHECDNGQASPHAGGC